jgi:HPt (histidine-containing phosphotransfer) domain-containing protein
MREMFLENGFSDFLPKPIEIPKLHKMLEKWVPEDRRAAPLKNDEDVSSPDRPFEFEIDGIDTAKGLAMCGSAPRYRDTLEIYCRDAESRLKFFEAANDDEGMRNLIVHVHAMKSASANIGAEELSKTAERLEEAGKNNDTRTISEDIGDFKMSVAAMIGRVRAALDKARDDAKSQSDSSGGIPQLSEMFRALRENIETENIDAIDEIIEELNALPLDARAREAVSKISDLVLMSEFGGAKRELDEFL